MSIKWVRSVLIVISILLVISIAYFGNMFLQKSKKSQEINAINLEKQKENEQIAMEDFFKKQEEQKKEQDSTNKIATEPNTEESINSESTVKEQNKLLEISKMSNEELITLVENIFGNHTEESILKYDPEYISGVLKVLGSKMKDLSEEQKQKIMNILEKSKPPQAKENK
jgi:hypothetical protein